MNIQSRPFPGRAQLPKLALACTLCAFAGCQTYVRQPQDLSEYRAELDARLESYESIAGFVDRMSRLGWVVPERFDPADGLTPAEGEVLALFYNADLRLARLAAGVALATYENSGLWEDPRFGFDGAEILSPSGPFQYGLTMNLTIPVSGRLGVEKDRAGAAYQAERRRIIDAEWATRNKVQSGWAAWTAAAERTRLRSEVIDQVERIATITDRLEAAGELTRAEARLLRAQLVQSRTDLAQSELIESLARAELLGLMGLPPDADIELLPSLTPLAPAVPGDAYQRLIESNSALAVSRAEYQVAEESLRLEIRKQYPDLSIGAGFGEESDDRLLLGVSVPIPVFNANRAGIADAKARREFARAAAESTYERLARELKVARMTLESTRMQRAEFERELVPMLDEQASELEKLAELGEVDSLLLLETVTRRFQAKDRLLDLRLAESRAMTDITRLLGPDDDASPAPVDEAGNTSRDSTNSEPTVTEHPEEGKQ